MFTYDSCDVGDQLFLYLQLNINIFIYVLIHFSRIYGY